MKTIAMTSPASFDVSYDINPWMIGNIGQVDRGRAVAQWEALHAVLEKIGVQLQILPTPSTANPDAVFTANAGLAFKNQFISSRFRYDERAGEEKFFNEYFATMGMTVVEPTFNLERFQVSFEGAGDALFNAERTILWFGVGWRSSYSYKPTLERLFEPLGVRVQPLELIAERFYHLDTCFCPLDTGELLWYPAAFTENSQRMIREHWGTWAHELDREDALAFAANAVSVGHHIVLPLVSAGLVDRLSAAGYEVHQVDMSEFLKSGGACKCLTLELVQPLNTGK